MLYAFAITVIYLVTGLGLGQWSWRVWDRSVKFVRTEKNGDVSSFYYSVKWSLELAILFPLTSRRAQFEWNEYGFSSILHGSYDYMRRSLDPERRDDYVAGMMIVWPFKVLCNLSIMAYLFVRLVFKMLWGSLLLGQELSSGKRIRESYLAKSLPKLRPSQPTDNRNKLLPAATTYARRLAELNSERQTALKCVEDIDKIISEVEQDMYERQGGPLRASPNVQMPLPEIGKRQKT